MFIRPLPNPAVVRTPFLHRKWTVHVNDEQGIQQSGDLNCTRRVTVMLYDEVTFAVTPA